ncbi:hypothetical protein [Porphyromonas sp.]
MALFFKIVHYMRFFWIATVVAYILYILYGIVTYLYSGQPWSFDKASDYIWGEPWDTLWTIYIIQKIVEAFISLFSNSTNPVNK